MTRARPGQRRVARSVQLLRVVDRVGLDGYNWGTTRRGSVWQSPAQVFGPTVAELRRVAPGKPLLLAETASARPAATTSQRAHEMLEVLRRRELTDLVAVVTRYFGGVLLGADRKSVV